MNSKVTKVLTRKNPRGYAGATEPCAPPKPQDQISARLTLTVMTMAITANRNRNNNFLVWRCASPAAQKIHIRCSRAMKSKRNFDRFTLFSGFGCLQ
jgi:hypothetical protein